MIMNEMKTNTGKLLVAVLAMAMLIAGAAIVFSDNVNAAVDETDVAQIGDEGYATLDGAVAAAQPGDTISLLKDVTLTKTITAIGLKIEETAQKHSCQLIACIFSIFFHTTEHNMHPQRTSRNSD